MIMQLPRIVVSDGTLEGLKWLALLLMVADHINKYLLYDASYTLFNAGRIAMPLFVFVLAYNLARPNAYKCGAHTRTMKRLGLFGLLATPPFIALGGLLSGWWPLNILFALLTMTAIIYSLEQQTISGNLSACAVFIVGGSSVEFWWPVLAFGTAIWWYCKTPRIAPLVIAMVALLLLRIINGNYWAFAALPILIASTAVTIPVPRYQWLFYYFYPLHLSLLWLSTRLL
ncbi:MAG: TraX family protein [Methylococcaceae bacterium]